MAPTCPGRRPCAMPGCRPTKTIRRRLPARFPTLRCAGGVGGRAALPLAQTIRRLPESVPNRRSSGCRGWGPPTDRTRFLAGRPCAGYALNLRVARPKAVRAALAYLEDAAAHEVGERRGQIRTRPVVVDDDQA